MSLRASADCWSASPFTQAGRFLVHLAIADVVNDLHENRLWMLRDELAAKSRQSKATATRAVSDLVAQGWLVTIDAGGGRGKPTEYHYHEGGKRPQIDTVCEALNRRSGMAKPSHSEAETVSMSESSLSTQQKEQKERKVEPPAPASAVAASLWTEAETLCNELADHVAALVEGAKRPTVTREWIADMERMLRIDERDPVHVSRCIAWVHRHEFWANNIRSPAKLRKQYDRLLVEASKDKGKSDVVDRAVARIEEQEHGDTRGRSLPVGDEGSVAEVR